MENGPTTNCERRPSEQVKTEDSLSRDKTLGPRCSIRTLMPVLMLTENQHLGFGFGPVGNKYKVRTECVGTCRME